MQVCLPLTEAANHSCPIIERLKQQLDSLRQLQDSTSQFEDYENELHALFAQAERDILAEDLQRLDIDEPSVEIRGTLYRRALRCYKTYQLAAGPIRVLRTLYRTAKEKSISPLELRAGIVESYWTARAAKQAVWMVAQLPPEEVSELLSRLGNMNPSTSSLARLPKKLSERWEQHREPFEAILGESFVVPDDAVTVASSLDGVMLPMKDGKRQEKRAKNMADGKRTRGPAGCREASCGTLSFYDAQGDRLGTLKLGRMPESKKVTLKQSLSNYLLARHWLLSA